MPARAASRDKARLFAKFKPNNYKITIRRHSDTNKLCKLRTSEGGQLWRDIEIANSGCHHARTMHKDVYYVVEEARRTCKKYGWNGAMDDDEAIDRFEECRLFYGRDLLYANLIRTLFDYRTGACHQAAYLREIARNGHIDFSKTPGEQAVPGGVDGDDDEFEGE